MLARAVKLPSRTQGADQWRTHRRLPLSARRRHRRPGRRRRGHRQRSRAETVAPEAGDGHRARPRGGAGRRRSGKRRSMSAARAGRRAELGFHSVQKTLPAATSRGGTAGRRRGAQRRSGDPRHPGPVAAARAISTRRRSSRRSPGEGRRRASSGQCRTACRRRRARRCVPCTPAGCMILIKRALAARPRRARRASSSAARTSSASRWRSFCSAENCTVTIAHSRTRDLPATVRARRHRGRRRRPAGNGARATGSSRARR